MLANPLKKLLLEKESHLCLLGNNWEDPLTFIHTDKCGQLATYLSLAYFSLHSPNHHWTLTLK